MINNRVSESILRIHAATTTSTNNQIQTNVQKNASLYVCQPNLYFNISRILFIFTSLAFPDKTMTFCTLIFCNTTSIYSVNSQKSSRYYNLFRFAIRTIFLHHIYFSIDLRKYSTNSLAGINFTTLPQLIKTSSSMVFLSILQALSNIWF